MIDQLCTLAAGARVVDHPFRHVTFAEGDLLPRAFVDRLLDTFPDQRTLVPSRRSSGSDKTYAVNTVTLYHSGNRSAVLDRVDPSWREFTSYLIDSTYREELAALLGVPPGPIDLELRLTEYPTGGWMSRHTDRPEKLFSQNIYLCPEWSPDWGGGLALYSDEHGGSPETVFLPGAGTSLAFARSNRSWHEVLAVSERAAAPRRALLVHGYRAAARTS